MKSELRCVFDTNTIVSAFLFEHGNPGRALKEALRRGQLLLSLEVAEEIAEVLRREKFDRYVRRRTREEFLRALIRDASFVQVTESVRECRDPDDTVLACLQERFDVRVFELHDVLVPTEEEESVPIEETEFWKEMERNRTGNLLAGARLKAGLTQGELGGRMGIGQSMISDYERGKRSLTPGMAKRFSKALNINGKHLQ